MFKRWRKKNKPGRGKGESRDSDGADVNPSGLLNQARQCLQEHRYDRMLEICDEVIAREKGRSAEHEDDDEIHKYFTGRGDFLSYIAALEQLAQNDKNVTWILNNCAEAWFLRGYALIELQDLDGAIESLKKAIESYPAHPDYLNELGHCYQVQGKHELAVEIFNKAVDTCRCPHKELGEQLEQLTELGQHLLAQGDTEKGGEALAKVDLVSRLLRSIHYSKEARALRGIGFSFIEWGFWDKAEEVFRESLQLEPDNERALHEIEYIRRNRPQ